MKRGNKIVYHPLVVKKDISRLDRPTKKRIQKAIETKLSFQPEIYGEPLRGTLKSYWKLRVGDWRIVYTVVRTEVRILIIAHRSEIYKPANERPF
ncbi:MAG TPA: type II toxin-antitoxin system RelE/ParE family toxin [Candidatus Paceibacterota bacterium]